MTMTTTKTKTTTEKPIETLPTNPFVFEILELASKQRSNAKKVEVLKTYEHDSLKAILIWNFDSTVISLLPEGEVPYGDVKDQNVYSGSSLRQSFKEKLLVESLQPFKIFKEGDVHLFVGSIKTFITL
jgi:hypothetical protein